MQLRKLLGALCGAIMMLALLPASASAHDPTEESAKAQRTAFLRDGNISPGGVPLEPLSDVKCEGGVAGIFPCNNVDLMSFLPLQSIEASFVNDIWGWERKGREFAIVGTWEGTAFIEVTEGKKPVYLGTLPSAVAPTAPFDPTNPEVTFTDRNIGNLWGDIRVHDDVAYIGAEAFDPETKEGFGVQVFDLKQLLNAKGPQTWIANKKVGNFSSHNLSLNEDSEVLYVVGARESDDICDNGGGGPIAYDVSDALNPELIGCVPEDGYTHDIQCVEYDGPDRDYEDDEICVAANEDTVTFLNLTDLLEGTGPAVILDKVQYLDLNFEPEVEGNPPNYYTHQGALSEDQDLFFLGDELDEYASGLVPRRTYVFDVSDLDNVQFIAPWLSNSDSIDHNMFVDDDLLYQANYTAGLTILNTENAETADLVEVGSFDVFPANDATEFFGAWGNYPYFDDGKVVVTSSDEGVFILDATDAEDVDIDDDDDDRDRDDDDDRDHDDDDDRDHDDDGREHDPYSRNR